MTLTSKVYTTEMLRTRLYSDKDLELTYKSRSYLKMTEMVIHKAGDKHNNDYVFSIQAQGFNKIFSGYVLTFEKFFTTI